MLTRRHEHLLVLVGLDDLNVGAVLPDLRRLLGVPPPRKQIPADGQRRRHLDAIDDVERSQTASRVRLILDETGDARERLSELSLTRLPSSNKQRTSARNEERNGQRTYHRVE